MGAAQTIKGGRKVRNKDLSLTEPYESLSETENAYDRMHENNQRSAFEAVSSHPTPYQNTREDNQASLERSSSLKVVTPKARHTHVTTSSSQSNIQGRSNSPSPSRRNANSKNRSTRSANGVNSPHASGPSASLLEPGLFLDAF